MITDTPILAIACGPTVTTWDLAQSTTSQQSNLFSASALAGAGTGIEQFKPHGNDNIVNDLAWNHNGQVIVTCSNATSTRHPHNVVLTHYATRSKLESFSNFHNHSTQLLAGGGGGVGGEEATSITFGGKSAKSRYLCVSDSSGIASVWDMKKVSRVRSFKLKHPVSSSRISNVSTTTGFTATNRPSCVKSAMDPSDTHVVALHGSSPSFGTNRIALEMFHLKTGSRVALLSTPEYQYGGGADCFEFSSFDDGLLLVGAKDGSLLLWDCTASSGIANHGHATSLKKLQQQQQQQQQQDHGPLAVLEQRHKGNITNVAYSPMNRVLAASCSMDGTVGFHDVGSKQTIQSIRPWDHCGKDVLVGMDVAARNKKGLSSLSFHHDGFTWAVGTETGIVFTYDLRQTGNGPLCTMIVSPSGNESIKKLQFVQTKGGGGTGGSGVSNGLSQESNSGGISSSIPKSSTVKKKIDMERDGVVTIEREKTTPSRREISKTTYSVTNNEKEPPTSTTTAASSVSSSLNNNPTDAKSSSSRNEKVTTSTSRITTKKIVTSSPQRTASSVLSSSTPERRVESTSTTSSEFQTTSPQRPGTTTRITKTRLLTSSSQNPTVTSFDFSSPPPSVSIAKDLFTNGSKDLASEEKNKSTIHKQSTSAKKEASVSFDDRIKRNIVPNDLSFDSNDKNEGSDKETEHMMEDFDAMYERIKRRALKKHAVTSEDFIKDKDDLIDQDDDSGDGIIIDNMQASNFKGNDETGMTESVQTKADENLTLSVLQIQDMIDDAVESLRDDVEETIQALQLDFLKQMQRQTDEVTALLQEHRQEIIRLQTRNDYLEKENKRLSGQM